MKFIIKKLKNIFDISLEYIDLYGIINSKDEDSVKYFLNFFLDVYSILNPNQTTSSITIDESNEISSFEINNSFVKKKLDDIYFDNSIKKKSLSKSYIQEQTKFIDTEYISFQKSSNNNEKVLKINNKKDIMKKINKKEIKDEELLSQKKKDNLTEDNKLKIYKIFHNQNNNNIISKENEKDPILSSEELKKEILKIIKILHKNKYIIITKSDNDRMDDIIIKVIENYAFKHKNPNTKKYLFVNEQKLCKFIKKILIMTQNYLRNNFPMKKNSEFIIFIIKYLISDYSNLRKSINLKKKNYEIEKMKKSKDLERVHDIFISALNLEGLRFIEEKNTQNEIMTQEEKKIVEEKILFNNSLKQIKRDLEEQEKYQRFKKISESNK